MDNSKDISRIFKFQIYPTNSQDLPITQSTLKIKYQSKQKSSFKLKLKSKYFFLALILLIFSLFILFYLFNQYYYRKNLIFTSAATKKIKINFLGDSITYGYGVPITLRFTSLLEKLLNIIANNYGQNGSTIAREGYYYSDDFNSRVQKIDKTANFTFVFGGTNDYWYEPTPLGDINSTDVYSFYGAIKTLLTEILKNFKAEQICFILPTPLHNPDEFYKRYSFNTYIDIIKDVCKLYKVDYLDLSSRLMKPIDNEYSADFIDGVHPNDMGHKAIAMGIKEYLEKKNIVKKDN